MHVGEERAEKASYRRSLDPGFKGCIGVFKVFSSRKEEALWTQDQIYEKALRYIAGLAEA